MLIVENLENYLLKLVRKKKIPSTPTVQSITGNCLFAVYLVGI